MSDADHFGHYEGIYGTSNNILMAIATKWNERIEKLKCMCATSSISNWTFEDENLRCQSKFLFFRLFRHFFLSRITNIRGEWFVLNQQYWFSAAKCSEDGISSTFTVSWRIIEQRKVINGTHLCIHFFPISDRFEVWSLLRDNMVIIRHCGLTYKCHWT